MNKQSFLEAKNELISGNYSVENYFEQNNFILELGYCKLLSGNIDLAQIEFDKIKDLDFRANWATKLIQIIKCKIKEAPSYFQIRNFLEIDLNLLLLAKQPEFVENIINQSDFLTVINPESYKFISRVMMNNDFLEVALFYLTKAKDKFYHDPEMHYMLATYYLKKNEIALAKESTLNCLKILPNYLPAKKLFDNLLIL